jgi:hypothetical protein
MGLILNQSGGHTFVGNNQTGETQQKDMLYTRKLWNGNYMNYELILPKERKLRKSIHFIVIPFVLIYMFMCICLFSVTLMFDGYRIVRFRYYKNDKSIYRLLNTTYRQMVG